MPNYSGVWKLKEVLEYIAAGEWPDATAQVALFGPVTGTSVDKILFESQGNATDFADLADDNKSKAAVGSSSRAVWAGGSGNRNSIDFLSFVSGGTASEFGDLTSGRQAFAGLSNATRGLFCAGNNTNIIDFITIATTGNATDFGDTTTTLEETPAGFASPTRGVIGGGKTSGDQVNIIQYMTIASTGNATDFGDLTQKREDLAGGSSSTRGVMAGGFTGSPTDSQVNIIDYVTIASTGNATDFGDLTVAREKLAGASSSIIVVFAGGENTGGSSVNVIDQVTVASTGNATDWGDLTSGENNLAGCSNAHGGLA